MLNSKIIQNYRFVTTRNRIMVTYSQHNPFVKLIKKRNSYYSSGGYYLKNLQNSTSILCDKRNGIACFTTRSANNILYKKFMYRRSGTLIRR